LLLLFVSSILILRGELLILPPAALDMLLRLIQQPAAANVVEGVIG